MTSEGLGEMFEGDSSDTGKFPLMLMGGRTEGLVCADPRARTPIGASGNLFYVTEHVDPFKTIKHFYEKKCQIVGSGGPPPPQFSNKPNYLAFFS